jgi:2-aminoethylphosphonate-pyruvate transaminase
VSRHYLLTPGPLTTSAATREAMLRDWGSRDTDFIALTARVRGRLLSLAAAEQSHSCVMLQGSGTFGVEAAIQTLVPRDGKLLILVNGAYGRRMVEMAQRLGRAHVAVEIAETECVTADTADAALACDPAITDVAVVHCETTSGILNPLSPIAEAVARHGKRLIIDAMSSFGAVPIDARAIPFTALVASSNKCLEGVPGIVFVLARTEHLAAARGNASSLSLDLHAQWQGFERDGQWRFTPPTQVLAALDAALDQHERDGGVAGRGARYRRNGAALIAGMRALGFVPLLDEARQGPTIVTFHRPPRLDFEEFYRRMYRRGFSLYPGKLAKLDTFRIGCIGAIDETVIEAAVKNIAAVVEELGLTRALLTV